MTDGEVNWRFGVNSANGRHSRREKPFAREVNVRLQVAQDGQTNTARPPDCGRPFWSEPRNLGGIGGYVVLLRCFDVGRPKAVMSQGGELLPVYTTRALQWRCQSLPTLDWRPVRLFHWTEYIVQAKFG